jgi:hypothetical protein
MILASFIGCTLEDSQAGRISDRLKRELGDNQIFMDVDAIRLGTNFVEALNKEVAKCDVLLALIGPNWLDLCDKNGRRLLDNPKDFVRIEIAAALQRQIPVIPILLEGTGVPNADQLPPDIKELELRQGLGLRNSSFHVDMDRLVRELKSPASAA